MYKQGYMILTALLLPLPSPTSVQYVAHMMNVNYISPSRYLHCGCYHGGFAGQPLF
jgi:hypothetical protein